MKKILLTVIVLIFCYQFISCKSKDSDQTYTLKMRLAIGDKVVENMENEVKTSFGDFKSEMKTNSIVEMEVIGDTADFKKLKFTTTKVNMSMDPPRPKTDTLMNKFKDKNEAKSITFLLNKKNEIVDIIGFNERMPDTQETGPAMQEFIKKMDSKDLFNSIIGQTFRGYPDHPVKVGDTWEKESDLSIGIMGIKMKEKYKLKEVENGIAIIQVEGKYNGKGKIEQGDLNVSSDIEGETNGKISVDMSDGYTKSSEYTMDMKSKSKAKGQNVDLPGSRIVMHQQTKRQ